MHRTLLIALLLFPAGCEKAVADRAKPMDKDSTIANAAKALSTKLTAVEEALYQTKNKSNQDPLNYPIRLNNKLAALAGVVGGAESKPTRQSVEVFRVLSDSLAIQTGKLKRALDTGLPPINREIERLDLKPIVPSTEEIK